MLNYRNKCVAYINVHVSYGRLGLILDNDDVPFMVDAK